MSTACCLSAFEFAAVCVYTRRILLVRGMTDYPPRSADSQRLIIPSLVSQFSLGLWYLSSPDRTIALSTRSLAQSVSEVSSAALYGFLTKPAPSQDETTVVETTS